MSKYIIINAEAIQKRIEWLEQRSLNKWQQDELRNLRLLLSQSTPLSPESIKPLQELVDEGYDPYDSAHWLQVQRMLEVIKTFISKFKLDI